MQVTSGPKQVGSINCGIFVGLQAEVLCQSVMGAVRMDEGAVVCAGKDPGVLQDEDNWFSENDVIGARLLLWAASLAYWLRQSPGGNSRITADMQEAEADLQKASREPVPERGRLWYAFRGWYCGALTATTSSEKCGCRLLVRNGACVQGSVLEKQYCQQAAEPPKRHSESHREQKEFKGAQGSDT